MILNPTEAEARSDLVGNSSTLVVLRGVVGLLHDVPCVNEELAKDHSNGNHVGELWRAT